MTHIRPNQGERLALSRAPQTLSAGQSSSGIDPHFIQATIAAKRAEIATLEADWAAASERAAARSLGGIRHLGPRETWDRATWNRYLTAASDQQDLYMPRLRRLYAEVENLQCAADAGAPAARRAA